MTSLDSIQQRQISLTHAYVVNNSARYSPSWKDIKNPSPHQVKDNILSRLNGSKIGGGYAVVWGPALAMDGDYAAHITVVLIGGKSGNDIVVVTSGTLGDSLQDQVDDLDIFPMVPLQELIKSCPVPASISPGTALGVQKILNTPSTIGVQGTLCDFLGKQRSGATIRLVGHSLGGALMSVLALYLKRNSRALIFIAKRLLRQRLAMVFLRAISISKWPVMRYGYTTLWMLFRWRGAQLLWISP